MWGMHHFFYKIRFSDKAYLKESDYYTLKLTKTTGADKKTPLEAMILDNLIHSYVALDNPLHIEYEYGYETIYTDVLEWKLKKNNNFKSLTIGGRGYTFPDTWKSIIRMRKSMLYKYIRKLQNCVQSS